MTLAYRPIHFVTDPFLGGRLPVAALVRTVGGVKLARAQLLPDARMLGGRDGVFILDLIVDRLESATDFDVLPRGMGPLVILAEEHAIPPGVEDPVAWVVDGVLPRPHGDESMPDASVGCWRQA